MFAADWRCLVCVHQQGVLLGTLAGMLWCMILQMIGLVIQLEGAHAKMHQHR